MLWQHVETVSPDDAAFWKLYDDGVLSKKASYELAISHALNPIAPQPSPYLLSLPCPPSKLACPREITAASLLPATRVRRLGVILFIERSVVRPLNLAVLFAI